MVRPDLQLVAAPNSRSIAACSSSIYASSPPSKVGREKPASGVSVATGAEGDRGEQTTFFIAHGSAIPCQISIIHLILVISAGIISHHDKLDSDLCVREPHPRFPKLTALPLIVPLEKLLIPKRASFPYTENPKTLAWNHHLEK